MQLDGFYYSILRENEHVLLFIANQMEWLLNTIR